MKQISEYEEFLGNWKNFENFWLQRSEILILNIVRYDKYLIGYKT
jgi:hypothetical protein